MMSFLNLKIQMLFVVDQDAFMVLGINVDAIESGHVSSSSLNVRLFDCGIHLAFNLYDGNGESLMR